MEIYLSVLLSEQCSCKKFSFCIISLSQAFNNTFFNPYLPVFTNFILSSSAVKMKLDHVIPPDDNAQPAIEKFETFTYNSSIISYIFLKGDYKLKEIAIYGKGGIGKSTLSANISAALSESGGNAIYARSCGL